MSEALPEGKIGTKALSTQDLGILLVVCRSATPRWRAIGIHLGIEVAELDIIRSNPQLIVEGVEGYFQEMLTMWLKQAPPKHQLPCLESLAYALRNIGEERLAMELPESFLQAKDARPVAAGTSQLMCEKLHLTEGQTLPFTQMQARYLKLLNGHGQITKELLHVEFYEIKEDGVRVFGTDDNIRKANAALKQLLERRQVVRLQIPREISNDVDRFFARCEEKNHCVVQKQCTVQGQRVIEIWAEQEETCTDAAVWVERVAYPCALMVKLPFSRYVQTSRRVHGKIVQLVPTPIKYCEAYLSREAGRGKKYFTIDVGALVRGGNPLRLQPTFVDSIRQGLMKYFKTLMPYQRSLKVGYEARFGRVHWELSESAYWEPSENAHRAPLDDFRPPPHKDGFPSTFSNRVTSELGDLLWEKCDTFQAPVIKLLDPLKMWVTSCGKKILAVAVVQEMDDGTFRLNNVFHQPLRGPTFDIVFPEGKYDIRIAPCCSPVVSDDIDGAIWSAAKKLVQSIHRGPDGTLSMVVQGDDYRVHFLRQKTQKQHPWNGKKWVLAEYDVQESKKISRTEDLPKDKQDDAQESKETSHTEDLPKDKQLPISFKNNKKEIELWNQKWFGDFAPRTHFTRQQYLHVESTAENMYLPGEYVVRGSEWTAEKLLEDFKEFLDAAVEIASKLSIA